MIQDTLRGMMNVKSTRFIVALVLVLATIAGASANQLTLASTDLQGSTKVGTFEYEVYTCTSGDTQADTCLTGELLTRGSTPNGIAVIDIPDTPSVFGYATFAFAPGYIPDVTFSDFTRGASVRTVPAFFLKAPNCVASVDGVSVVNQQAPNMPIIVGVNAAIGADVDSPFFPTARHVFFAPESRKAEYFSADVELTLEVTNRQQGVQFRDTILLANDPNAQGAPLYVGEIGANQRRDITFDAFTPGTSLAGQELTATVTSRVIDDQCANTATDDAFNRFFVYDEAPRNKAFTNLNEVKAQPQFVITGGSTTVSFTTLSQVANDFASSDPNYRLTTVPTATTITVTDGSGNVVNTIPLGNLQAGPHSTNVPLPATLGTYTIKVEGLAVFAQTNPPIENQPRSGVATVTVIPSGQFTVTLFFKDSVTNAPIRLVNVNLGGKTGTTNDQGSVTLGPFAQDRYNLLAVHPQYDAIMTQVDVTRDEPGLIYAMVFRGGNPPVEPTPQEPGFIDGLIDKIKHKFKRSSIQVSRTEIPGGFELLPGQTVDVYVNLENMGEIDFDEARVFVTVPDLNLYTSEGPFDLDDGRQRPIRFALSIPEDTPPGRYPVKIEIYTNKVRQVVWREIEVH